jgi:hypothetical protein
MSENGVKIANEIVQAINQILQKYEGSPTPYSSAEGVYIYIQKNIGTNEIGAMLYGNVNRRFAVALAKMCIDDALSKGKGLT